MEERMAHNSLKLQVLREDYQEMLATHANLKQDLTVAHLQLRQLATTAHKVSDHRQSEVKQVYERCVTMEGEARLIEALQIEHDQVSALVSGVRETNVELKSQLRELDSELHSFLLQTSDVAPLKSDLNTMRQQLLQGRAAIEFENKTRAANLEQYQAMERNMISMKNEIEKLRDELAHAQKRANVATTAVANPSHAFLDNYRGPDMLLQGGLSSHYPMHQTTIHGERSYPAVFGQPPNGGHDPYDAHSDSCNKG
ncbi:hypothetical protein RND81_01G119700 [Saponaria officinalis]|uniref:Uncharacterized protein n=1 Tax=Saponaria officinalis TaxID=3572 RepID=A0AAW1NGE0_SAPOF